MSNSTPPESEGEGDRPPPSQRGGGYGAPPPPPPGYGEGVGWSGPASTNNTKAILALAFGVLGLVVGSLCFGVGFFIGIPAIILGLRARQQIDASGGKQGGRGMATAGLVLGVLSCVLIVVVIVLYATGALTFNAQVG
jgi:uncharacterized protein DUF4190